MIVLSGIHGIGGMGAGGGRRRLQRKVPEGPQKARQSGPGRAGTGLGLDSEPNWSNQSSTLAHMPFASASKG